MSSNELCILAPVSQENFLTQFWEKETLHIERTASDYFSQLLSIEEIEILLSTGGQRFPDVQLVNAATDVPVGEYTDADQRIAARGLWAHYRDGATVVVSGAERRFHKLAELCRSVSAQLGMRSQANLYVSGPTSGCQASLRYT